MTIFEPGARMRTQLGQYEFDDLGFDHGARKRLLEDMFGRRNYNPHSSGHEHPYQKYAAEKVFARPFTSQIAIANTQEARRFLVQNNGVFTLVDKIVRFYMRLRMPFSERTKSELQGGVGENGLYIEVQALKRDCAAVCEGLKGIAGLLDTAPTQLRTVLTEMRALFDAVRGNLDQVVLQEDGRGGVDKFFDSVFRCVDRIFGKVLQNEVSPGFSLGEETHPNGVRVKIEQLISKEVSAGSDETPRSVDDEETPIFWLELVYSLAYFENKLSTVVHDPIFTSDGSLDLSTLHQPLQLLKPDGKPSLPQERLQLATDQNIIVIAGPISAGKSHLLKALAQQVLLAQSGAPITAEGRLPLVRKVLTHQPRPPASGSEVGKLEHQLQRLAHLRDNVVPGTFVFIDEILDGVAPRPVVTDVRETVVNSIVQKGGRVALVTHDLELVAELGKRQDCMVYMAVNDSTTHQFAVAPGGNVNSMVTDYDAAVADTATRYGFDVTVP